MSQPEFGAELPPWLQTPEEEGAEERSQVVADEQEPDWLKKKKERQVSFLLTPDIKARIEALAARLDASRSEVARELLKAALDMVDSGELVFDLKAVDVTQLVARRRGRQ